MKNLPEFWDAGNFAQRGLSQIDQSWKTVEMAAESKFW
jgi:hypothetical protein